MALDGSPGEEIARIGPFQTPAGTGVAAFTITHDFGTEPVTVPGAETFFAGFALSANANWTADGQSVHIALYTDPASPDGDPCRVGAPNHAWNVHDDGTRAQPSSRTWRFRLYTDRGVFQVGAIQGTTNLYGMCGNYPDVTTQGLSFRIIDAASPNQMAAVLWSTSLTGGVPGIFDGHLWIAPGQLQVLDTGMLDGNGVAEFTPAATAPGSAFLQVLAGTGNLPFQGVILDANNAIIRTTNAQASDL